MKRLIAVLSILIGVSMLLGACAPAAAPSTPAPAAPTAMPAPTTAPAPTQSVADVVKSLPRNQTLYFNGQQWGAVVGMAGAGVTGAAAGAHAPSSILTPIKIDKTAIKRFIFNLLFSCDIFHIGSLTNLRQMVDFRVLGRPVFVMLPGVFFHG